VALSLILAQLCALLYCTVFTYGRELLLRELDRWTFLQVTVSTWSKEALKWHIPQIAAQEGCVTEDTKEHQRCQPASPHLQPRQKCETVDRLQEHAEFSQLQEILRHLQVAYVGTVSGRLARLA